MRIYKQCIELKRLLLVPLAQLGKEQTQFTQVPEDEDDDAADVMVVVAMIVALVVLLFYDVVDPMSCRSCGNQWRILESRLGSL